VDVTAETQRQLLADERVQSELFVAHAQEISHGVFVNNAHFA
jgi:hypothetical protein